MLSFRCPRWHFPHHSSQFDALVLSAGMPPYKCTPDSLPLCTDTPRPPPPRDKKTKNKQTPRKQTPATAASTKATRSSTRPLGPASAPRTRRTGSSSTVTRAARAAATTRSLTPRYLLPSWNRSSVTSPPALPPFLPITLFAPTENVSLAVIHLVSSGRSSSP